MQLLTPSACEMAKWWIEQNKKTVKIGGIRYTLAVSTHKAVYPYPHTALRVFATMTNKQSEGYRETRKKLGDDWSTDVLESWDFCNEVMAQLNYKPL